MFVTRLSDLQTVGKGWGKDKVQRAKQSPYKKSTWILTRSRYINKKTNHRHIDYKAKTWRLATEEALLTRNYNNSAVNVWAYIECLMSWCRAGVWVGGAGWSQVEVEGKTNWEGLSEWQWQRESGDRCVCMGVRQVTEGKGRRRGGPWWGRREKEKGKDCDSWDQRTHILYQQ